MKHPLEAIEIRTSVDTGRLVATFHRYGICTPKIHTIPNHLIPTFIRIVNTSLTFCTTTEAILYPYDILVTIDVIELRRRLKQANPHPCNPKN